MKWDDSSSVKSSSINVSEPAEREKKERKKLRAIADGLNPGATYTLRLTAKDSSGNSGIPGPDLIVDTEAVSCTPKPACVIS